MSETDATRCVVCGGPFSEVRIHIDGRTYHQRCSIMSHPPHTWEDYARLSDECERLRLALAEIAKGEGRFSTDHLTHASNTIEDMKQLALAALTLQDSQPVARPDSNTPSEGE